jgi:hypothetical protein
MNGCEPEQATTHTNRNNVRRLRMVSLVSFPTSLGRVPFRFSVDAINDEYQKEWDEPTKRMTELYRWKLTNLEELQVFQSSNFHWNCETMAIPGC